MIFQALYLHIPFCKRKCNYCDFISYTVKDYPEKRREYISLLLKEIDYWRLYADFRNLDTIYLGGGTPTVIDYKDLVSLISCVKKRTGLKDAIEITVEVNPGTIDLNGLKSLYDTGVNRLSIGIESFCNKELRNMGRIHNVNDAKKIISDAKKAGFENLNIDLIYGLPGQTKKQWSENLQSALDMDTQHISIYGLTLSEDTPWGKDLAKGKISLPDSDLSAELMELGIEKLTSHGFNHYEIANFAIQGYESRHNLAYWQRKNYLGLGVSASSCHNNHRFSNYRHISEYADAINAGKPVICEEEFLSRREVLAEAMFLGLRLLDGISLSEFASRYKVKAEIYFSQEIEKLSSLGLLEKEKGRLRLTKKGLLLANEVFMHFLP